MPGVVGQEAALGEGDGQVRGRGQLPPTFVATPRLDTTSGRYRSPDHPDHHLGAVVTIGGSRTWCRCSATFLRALRPHGARHWRRCSSSTASAPSARSQERGLCRHAAAKLVDTRGLHRRALVQALDGGFTGRTGAGLRRSGQLGAPSRVTASCRSERLPTPVHCQLRRPRPMGTVAAPGGGARAVPFQVKGGCVSVEEAAEDGWRSWRTAGE